MITSDDILGKEAIDSTGKILGTVTKLHIDEILKEITGITIDMGFMKPDLFIGLNHIKEFGIDTVMLNKIPVERYKGLNVLSRTGKKIGVVVGIKVAKIYPKFFEVSKGINKKTIIPISQVELIGDAIILKK